MSKQDRQGVRTPADIERKYNLGEVKRTFEEYRGGGSNVSAESLKQLEQKIQTDVDRKLGNYARNDDLTDYVLRDDMDDYALKGDLNDYALKGDLNDYALKGDLNDYALKDDLNDYALKDDLNDYAQRDDLNDYAKKTDLENYATSDDLGATNESLSSLRQNVSLLSTAVQEITQGQWYDLTLGTGFIARGNASNLRPVCKCMGTVVTVCGIVSNSAAMTVPSDGVVIASGILAEHRPHMDHHFVCQSANMDLWRCAVKTDGTVTLARIGTTAARDLGANTWLPFTVTYQI